MYGRARRINALKTLGIVAAVTLVVAVIVLTIFKVVASRNKSDNFVTLRNYLTNKGYNCELIEESGASCKYEKEGVLVRFIRFDDGFEYSLNKNAYFIDIKYTKDENKFIFRTTDQALAGYRNRNYSCTFENRIIDSLKDCKDDEGRVLDAKVYRGVINSFMNDLGMILKSSGYDVDKLLKDYQWVEKK